MSFLPRLLLLFSVLVAPLAGEAVFRSQSMVAMEEVCSAHEEHRLAHGPLVMERWEDFDRLWGAGRQPEVFETLRLKERYEIVDWPAPAGNGDRSVMVGRSAFRDSRKVEHFFGELRTLGENGRWIVVRSVRDGSWRPEWMPEPRFREWIRREDLPLPSPDTVGIYPHVVPFWSRLVLIALPVLVVMGAALLRALRRNRSTVVPEMAEA